MPDKKHLNRERHTLDPSSPKKEKSQKSRKFENPVKDMLYIFSFFKNLNSKAIVSYILTFSTFAFVYLLALVSDMAGIRQYIVTIIAWLICVISVFIIIPFVPYGINSGRPEIRRFMIKRYIGNIVTVFMINIAVSFGICFAVVGVIGGVLFNEDQHLASLIIKSILYIIFLWVLYTLIGYNGNVDTASKTFNPHVILQSTVLAQTFMLTVIRFDWYNYNALGRDLFYNSQTFLGELGFIRELKEAGFIIGNTTILFITCLFALYFYKRGRNAFFKKHPNELSYDLKEVNSIINNSGGANISDVM